MEKFGLRISMSPHLNCWSEQSRKKIFFGGGVGRYFGYSSYISDDSKNYPHPRSHSFTVISFTQNKLKFTNITFTSYNILTPIFEMGSLLALFIYIVEILGPSPHNS